MKEFHAYKNDDGTYKLEVIADYYEHNELKEAHVIFPRVNVVSDSLYLKPNGDLFRVEVLQELNEHEYEQYNIQL